MNEGANSSTSGCQPSGLLVPGPTTSDHSVEDASGVGPLYVPPSPTSVVVRNEPVSGEENQPTKQGMTEGGKKGKLTSASESATGKISALAPNSGKQQGKNGNNGNKTTTNTMIVDHHLRLSKTGPLTRFDMVEFKCGTTLNGEADLDYEATIALTRNIAQSSHNNGKQGVYLLGDVERKVMEYLVQRFGYVHCNVAHVAGSVFGGKNLDGQWGAVFKDVSYCKCDTDCTCGGRQGKPQPKLVLCFDWASPWYLSSRLNSLFTDMSQRSFTLVAYTGHNVLYRGAVYQWASSENRYTSVEPGASTEALFRFDPRSCLNKQWMGETDVYRGSTGKVFLCFAPFMGDDMAVPVVAPPPQAIAPILVEPVPGSLEAAAQQLCELRGHSEVSKLRMATVGNRKVVELAIGNMGCTLPLELYVAYEAAVVQRGDANASDLVMTANSQMRTYATKEKLQQHQIYGDAGLVSQWLVLSASLQFMQRLAFAKQVETNFSHDDVRTRTIGMESAKPVAHDEMKVKISAFERSKNWVVKGLWDRLVSVAMVAKPSFASWLSSDLNVEIWQWVLGLFGVKAPDTAMQVLTSSKKSGVERDGILEREYGARKNQSSDWHLAVLVLLLLTCFVGFSTVGGVSTIRHMLGSGFLLAFKFVVWWPLLVLALYAIGRMKTNARLAAMILFVGVVVSLVGSVRAEETVSTDHEDLTIAILTWVMSGGLAVACNAVVRKRSRHQANKVEEAKIQTLLERVRAEKLPPKPRFATGVADEDVHLCFCSGYEYEEQQRCPSACIELNHENLRCKPKWGNVRTAGGVVARNGKVVVPFVFSGCSHNILRAVLNRQCLYKGVDEHGESEVQRAAWLEVVNTFCSFDMFDNVQYEPVTDSDVAEWKARFPAAQRARFKRVEDEARCSDIQVSHRVLEVEAFVKRENTMYKTENLDPAESDPRLICNGTPEQQVRNGPMWYKIGKLFKKCFGKDGFLVYAGGLNGQDMSDVYNRAVARWHIPFCFWTDCSRFDGRISKHALEAQDSIMSTIPGYPSELSEFTVSDREVRAKAMDGSLRFRVSGTRKSGRNDTSVGNSLLNAAAHVWALVAMGFTRDEIMNQMVMYFMGDDNIVFMDPSLAGRFDSDVLESCLKSLGWKPEVGFSYNPIADRANFLSSIWLPTNNGYAFVPMPERSLVKGTFLTNTTMTKEEWCPDVFMTHAATYSGIPILWLYWKRLSELYPHGKVVVDEHKPVDVHRQWSRASARPDRVTYRAFCEAHHLSLECVESCEWYLENQWDPRTPADHRALYRLMDLLY